MPFDIYYLNSKLKIQKKYCFKSKLELLNAEIKNRNENAEKICV